MFIHLDTYYDTDTCILYSTKKKKMFQSSFYILENLTTLATLVKGKLKISF